MLRRPNRQPLGHAMTSSSRSTSPARVGRPRSPKATAPPSRSRSPVAAPAARPGLSEQARARLEEMIVSLELAPGSIWSEAQLSAKLGIGRTPVREALQRLEADHLVRILRRHGAQITEINVVEQLLLLELRRDLDRSIARHAARRSTAQERARLLEMAERLASRTADDDDILPYLRDHYELKNFLAECARNPFVARAVMPCYAMSRRFYYLHHRQARDLAVATRHHIEVIRAVAIGDEKKAAAASDKLMDYVEEFTRATVTNRF
jgi:DNA-binding GntR family transcriptional regulator